jgi:CheY-like chemotaxis protein
MSQRKPSVMVVDDSNVVLERLHHTLQDAGYDVTVRSSALGTVAAVLKQKPDVLLLDVNMPALAGDRLATVLGEMGQEVTIILHSSRPAKELHELARTCGAHGVIPKTHDLKSFLLQFESILFGSARLRTVSGKR